MALQACSTALPTLSWKSKLSTFLKVALSREPLGPTGTTPAHTCEEVAAVRQFAGTSSVWWHLNQVPCRTTVVMDGGGCNSKPTKSKSAVTSWGWAPVTTIS
jgi:hypothetical protein